MSNSMTDIEYDAFIEHLKSSEIYKKVRLNTYRSYPENLFRASGEMAQEHEDEYYQNAYNINWDNTETSYFKNGRYYALIGSKMVTIKGYFDGKTRRFPK
tara:strand:- start:1095 stop:1394 length:300 start_codon:yes stop_codon:yes gene_type:complete